MDELGLHMVDLLRAALEANERGMVERAVLRGQVEALLVRLGEVLALVDGRQYMTPEQQIVLANARALRALISGSSAA